MGKSQANKILIDNIYKMQNEDIQYTNYKRKELERTLNDIQSGKTYALDGYKDVMKTIPKIGIHPTHYQNALSFANKAFLNLKSKF